jgi:hypothetical protein
MELEGSMEQGWIYVLVNSSTPGLVKVGRTARPPADRAAELSAATGVPTPFVVAFDQAFADCCEAERLIHAELDRRGLRVAPNREFFRGPPSDIIRIIIDMAAGDTIGAATDPSADPLSSAERLCQAGDNALFGLGESLQDTGEALRCYKLAALRGSLRAYERIGRIYVQLYENARNRAGRRRAMNVLKEGVRRGNYYCYCEMATLLAIEHHLANFAKSWDLFFARRTDSYREALETDPTSFPAACSRYIAMALDLASPPRHLAEMTANADAILAALLAELDHVKDHPPSRQRVAAIMRWAHEKLRPAPPKRKRRRLLPLWSAEADSAAA